MYRNGIKRLLAVVLSLCGMICLSWLFLILAVAIKLDSPGPVFFKQKRVGIGKKHFYILKFRTMRIDTPHDMPTHLLHDPDQYITRMGHFLRKTSLDELPQLVNIFHGDMTLVGPRPEMVENVEKYKAQYPAFVYRERMKAGLTGYAQIEGKYNTTPEDKLMLDLMYIESFSIWLDVKLLFRTLTVFFKADSTEGFDAPASTDTKHDKSLSA